MGVENSNCQPPDSVMWIGFDQEVGRYRVHHYTLSGVFLVPEEAMLDTADTFEERCPERAGAIRRAIEELRQRAIPPSRAVRVDMPF